MGQKMQGFCLAAVIFGRKIGLYRGGIFSAREKRGILRVANRNLMGVNDYGCTQFY